MTDPSPRICVFCGSNAGSSPALVETARALGAQLAQRSITLVYGGSHIGLMGAMADTALEGGGEVIGVIPEHLVNAEVAHTGLSQLEVTASMHARKARMAELANGFVALPGGFGTLEEVLEILTWNQLGLVAKPVVFLDVEEFYAPLLNFFDRAVEARFVAEAHRALARRATTVDEALELALTPVTNRQSKWTDRDGEVSVAEGDGGHLPAPRRA